MRAPAAAISRCTARGCIRSGECTASICWTIEWSGAVRPRATLVLSNVSFSRDNLLNLTATSEYDLITNTDVLEHIEDDVGAMANLARALAPGGYLLLTFPSVPQRRHLKLVAWRERRIGFKPEDIGHVRPGYSPAMMDSLARAVGLETVKTVWTYGPFGNLAHDLFFVTRRQQAESDCVRGVVAVPARAELSGKSHADATWLRDCSRS